MTSNPPEQTGSHGLNRRLQGIHDRLQADGHIADVMPHWTDDKRAITNSIARSAVFSVVEKGRREILIGQRVPAPSNYEIVVTGERLSEADRDVYLQAIHYFRGCGQNEEAQVNPRDFLLAIGRQDGLDNRRWLWNTIRKIAKTLLEITISLPNSPQKIHFVGALLTMTSEENDGIPGDIRMTMPLDALRLYNADGRTLICMSRRLSLKGSGSQLAKSLHIKIYSHKEPFPVKIETLMAQCGSQYKRIQDFKKKLIVALKLLKNKEEIEDYSISKDGLVDIRRKERKQA